MANTSTPSFAKAFEELERIVTAFEAGDIDLERDLPKFERGLKLAAVCRERLKTLENQVKRIEKTFHADNLSDAVKGREEGETAAGTGEEE